jgi:phenylacetate-CoA ligase
VSETQRTEPERLGRSEIEQLQAERLRTLLDAVVPSNPFWTQKFRLAGIDISSVRTPADLQNLPFTNKSELVSDHAAHPPYGTNLTYELTGYSRIHQTSGTTERPLRWLDTSDSWDWFARCWEQIYRMVGLRRDDRLAFPFSFGPFIGFWAAFEGAARLGNLCLAGGGMSSTARLQMIKENQATIVCCTPTYALRLAEVAEQQQIDLAGGSVRALIVAGEPGGSIPATRSRIEELWGARVFDHWGMTDIGSLAVESVERPGGLYILETECIAEIVDPDTGRPVTPGDEGELVLTNLGRLGSPLIRYRTGDLARASTATSPDGYELLYLEGGILGRADDMVIIRGNNVFPSTLEAILRRYNEIVEYRITVETRRAMEHLRIEIEPAATCDSPDKVQQLVETVGSDIKDRLNFQAEITAVAMDTLPRFELKGRRFVRN